MPRWLVRMLLLVLVAAVAVTIVAAVLFNVDGSDPGSGRGETITGPTTP